MAESSGIRQETTARDFVNVVFRRKWIILGVVGVATFLVFFLNARRPNMYVSASKILVSRGEQESLVSGHVRYLKWEEEVSSHIQVILSDAVFSKAKRMFSDSVRVHGYPSHWAYNAGAVRADVVGESNAFVLSYNDFTPDMCQLGCAVTTLAFQEYYRERQPPELTDFFSSELTDVSDQLSDWRSRRQDFLNKEKFYGTDETSRFLLGRIGSLETLLVERNGAISSQSIRVNNLDQLRRETGAQLEKELAFSTMHQPLQTSVVQRIKDSLQKLNLEREGLLGKYTDKHPEVIAANEQIKMLHEDLKRQVDNSYRVENETLEGMVAQQKALETELLAARAELNAIPDKDRTVAEIDNMITKLEAKHNLLLRRQSESDIALAGRPDWEVSVLSGASRPTNRKRNDYIRLLLGPFLAVIVGLGLAFFLESADHSIKNGAEAEEFLGAPVLATVSEIKQRKTA